jgi:leader peptidase (prepilin peptidase)/N-methyltransferase
MTALVVVLSSVFGLAIGSFLNVVIYRVPLGRSVVSPPSACPGCGHSLNWYDNVPVLSWVVLRGRCRYCRTPIAARYPAVELFTAVLFGFVAWGVASEAFSVPARSTSGVLAVVSTALTLVALLYLAAVSIALAFIDIEHHKLPNAITLPSYVIGAVLLALSSLLAGDASSLLRAAIGGAGLFAAYYLLAMLYRGGMGFGDVKLAGILGSYLGWFGWAEFAVGAFAPFLLGGVFSVVLLALKRAGRATKVPFGPWMLAGAWVGIGCGPLIASWYLGLFGLV